MCAPLHHQVQLSFQRDVSVSSYGRSGNILTHPPILLGCQSYPLEIIMLGHFVYCQCNRLLQVRLSARDCVANVAVWFKLPGGIQAVMLRSGQSAYLIEKRDLSNLHKNLTNCKLNRLPERRPLSKLPCILSLYIPYLRAGA